MKKLSTKEMKEVAYEIISKELEKHNLKVNIYPVKFFEYYTKYIPNTNFDDIKDFLDTIIYPLFNNYAAAKFQLDEQNKATKNSIFVFIDDFKKINYQLFLLILCCYHETIHSVQASFDNYSYSKYLFNMEIVLLKNDQQDYNKNHNNYSIEIGANLYGIFKTEDFLKNKYPDIYELEKDYIKDLENSYKLNYMLYDAVGQMNKVLELVNEKNLKINDEIPIFNIFNIFIKDDNSFKSIEDMLKNPNYDALDKRIIYTVLSSDLFLKSINITELSNEEFDTLNEALQYTYTVYNNQYKFIWEKFNNGFDNSEINFKFFIESAERLIENIKKIDKYLLLLNNVKENKEQQFSKNIKIK